MKEKKEKSTLLVVFTIFILLLLIVLPPIFRVLFPRQEIIDKNEEIITILNCSKESYTDMYNINLKSRYVNNKIKSSEIFISPLNNVNDSTIIDKDQSVTTDIENVNYITATELITFFSSLNNIQMDSNNGNTKIIIDSKLLLDNEEHGELNSYYNELEVERTYFTSQGYNCNIISS